MKILKIAILANTLNLLRNHMRADQTYDECKLNKEMEFDLNYLKCWEGK